jgi:hypothetical protein
MTIEERQQYARDMFRQHPAYFPAQHREPILNGRVLPGMAPFEARLAGGAFVYHVTADRKVWPPGSDPIKVLWAQSDRPDDSRIVMRFNNATQFQDKKERPFVVLFQKGKAVEIKVIGK